MTIFKQRPLSAVIGGITFAFGLLPHDANAAEDVYLVQDGKARAEIVRTQEPPRTVQLAAEELQTYLRKMTGADLPIVEAPTTGVANQIYVGKSEWTDRLGVSSDGLKDGAFRMASGANWLALVGADRNFQPKEPWQRSKEGQADFFKEWDKITGEHFGNFFIGMYRKFDPTSGMWEFDLDNAGSFNAVNKFLRDQGVRWYMKGDLGEVVPQKTSIPLPQVNETVTPDFPLRQLYQYGGNFFTGSKDEILWQLRLGTNQGYDLVGFGPNGGVAHGIKAVVNRDEMKAAHPEYYQLLGGRRMTDEGVPSLVSDGLVEANVRYLRKIFDTYDLPMVSVMPTDGFTAISEDAADKETPERGRLGSLSDYVWEYVVKVANELAKTHPDKKIQCLAYTTYLMPPEKIDKLPPNVVVGIAQNRSAYDSPESKKLFRDIREGWLSKITSGVLPYQYEYYLQDHSTRPWKGLPVLYPHLIVEDLRYLKGQSIGDFAEVNRVGINPVNMMNIYVTARFYWDVNQDLDAMLDEYYRLFYGPAEQPMKEFYGLAEKTWKNLSGADAQKLVDLLGVATKAAGDGVYGKRVALVKETCESGLLRVVTLQKEPDLLRLGYLDETGKEPIATVDALPVFPLKDALAGDKLSENGGQVSLGWTKTALFVRVVCDESDMNSLRKFATEKDDSAIFRDDSVDIAIATPNHTFYQISINPAGVVADLDGAKQALDGIGWDAKAVVKTSLEDKRWIVEAVIPLSTFGGKAPSLEAPWKINVGRNRPRGTDRIYSSLAPTGQRTLAKPDRMLKAYFEENP